MNNHLALTVRPDDLEDLLESLWHLLWQAAQPLAHPGVRIPLVARRALSLARSLNMIHIAHRSLTTDHLLNGPVIGDDWGTTA